MTAHRDVDLFLRAHFETTADTTVLDGQIDAVLSETAAKRQQPAWLAALRSHTMSTTARSLGRPVPAPAWALLIILALLIAITTIGLTTGTLRLPSTPITNGPIVFGRFVDAAEDTAIVMTGADGSGEHIVVPAPVECPQLSPDGRQVLFAFGVVNVDGTNRRAFADTYEGASLGCSTWSPDGSRIAIEGFNDNDQSRNGIYLANAEDGGNVVRLTTNGENGNDIPGDWSPDGRHIAFQRGIGNNQGELWVVDVANGATHRVLSSNIAGAAWSHDGQWLAGLVGRDFILVHPDGTGYRVVPIPVDYFDGVGAPSFSPDGARFVFNMGLLGTRNDIYTMKVDGTDLVQITDTPNDDEYFVDWGVDPR